ncbi:MarR family winged helix-turn-helix transcriptional regulator [Parafrigoribacterium soli]|uniref:MarR family winged helix-turn-helix transcriptional regulator n=1 Tax=Parafrigoribacterium soli TaxID=3144663 RepID=UPI0032EC332C
MRDPTKEREILEIAARFETVARTHSATAAAALDRYGVSGATSGLIWALGTAETNLSMSQLADRLFCDPSNVTLLAEQLERLGLAERIPDPHDRRRRILKLTDEGHAAWSATQVAVVQASPLSTLDESTLAALREALFAHGT